MRKTKGRFVEAHPSFANLVDDFKKELSISFDRKVSDTQVTKLMADMYFPRQVLVVPRKKRKKAFIDISHPIIHL